MAKKSDFKINVYCISNNKEEFSQFAAILRPAYCPIYVNEVKHLDSFEIGDIVVNLGDALLKLEDAPLLIQKIKELDCKFYPYCLEFILKFCLSKISTETELMIGSMEMNHQYAIK